MLSKSSENRPGCISRSSPKFPTQQSPPIAPILCRVSAAGRRSDVDPRKQLVGLSGLGTPQCLPDHSA
jgi:hypothetical protein